MVQYYCDMWAKRSEMLAPLSDLVGECGETKTTRKNKVKKQPWHWDSIHQIAFDNVKTTIAKEVVLAYPDFIAHYERELEDAKKDCRIGGLVEKNITALPGITEFRYNQLQEIEAVLNYLNIQLRKIRRKHFQKYLEGYARALTSRDAEKYVDGEDEVIDYETIINEVAYLRNRWLGIMKGLDTKQWQMGHVVRLRTAGMEDIQV